MWLPWKPHEDEEAGLKLGRLQPGRERRLRRLVPWWVGAMRRAKAANVMRRQPKTSAGGGGLRRRVAPSRMYGRRSVVKASFRRNRGKGAWVTACALSGARTGATRTRSRPGLRCRSRGPRYGCDGTDVGARRRADVVADRIAGRCRADEFAQHARALVADMERDLGTQLEWIAIDHHNTDDAHIHMLIRGVRDDGKVLKLDRDYVSRGIRELSRELAERELGPRD